MDFVNGTHFYLVYQFVKQKRWFYHFRSDIATIKSSKLRTLKLDEFLIAKVGTRDSIHTRLKHSRVSRALSN